MAYSDASLGREDPEGLSTTGYVVKLFGDSIAWGTNWQRIVATSTMEAEYLALSKTAKELVYFSNLCKLVIGQKMSPVIFEDNTAAIIGAKSEVSKALKHIVKLKYHYVRQAVKNKEIELEWVLTVATNRQRPVGSTFEV